MSFTRLDVLLTARDGISPHLLGHLLADGRERLHGDGTSGFRIAMPMLSGADAPAAAAQTNPLRTRFDLVVSLGGVDADIPEMVASHRAMLDRLDGLWDPSRSAAMTGHVDVVISGDGPVFSLYPLRRLPGLTFEQFENHWSKTHADLARAVPGLSGYRQFHLNPEQTRWSACALGVAIDDFDGAAEGRRVEAAVSPAPGPALDAVLEDEKTFVDVSRCGPALYRAIPGFSRLDDEESVQ